MREATPLDYLILGLARQIRPGEVVFHGVNSILPMVAVAVARRVYTFPFTYLNIAGGVNPDPCALPRSSTDPCLAHGSAAVFSNEDFYDLCARGGVDLIFLGAAQVDARGQTNVSVIGEYKRPKVRLPGGGGAAVLMPTAGRVVIWRTEHSARSFPKRLDFVTAAGNVDRVVTPLCIFQRIGGRLRVESVHPTSSLEEVRRNTGFSVTERDVPSTPRATDAELEAIEAVDPHGRRFLEDVRA